MPQHNLLMEMVARKSKMLFDIEIMFNIHSLLNRQESKYSVIQGSLSKYMDIMSSHL